LGISKSIGMRPLSWTECSVDPNIRLMRLADCYRLLDLDPGASGEEVKRAHRDLTKVWHPDRFGNDAALRQKAEEKLKAINQAYETIRAGRPDRDEPDPPPAPGREARADGVRRNGTYALTCALIAIFVLLRRPSPAGLVIALVLFVAAFVFISRMRGSGTPE
ncbi:MAG TPA: J domain-containing protein, partial [Haliangium sp.]|nr:J domain-containing protein [Haliangium sp.]